MNIVTAKAEIENHSPTKGVKGSTTPSENDFRGCERTPKKRENGDERRLLLLAGAPARRSVRADQGEPRVPLGLRANVRTSLRLPPLPRCAHALGARSPAVPLEAGGDYAEAAVAAGAAAVACGSRGRAALLAAGDDDDGEDDEEHAPRDASEADSGAASSDDDGSSSGEDVLVSDRRRARELAQQPAAAGATPPPAQTLDDGVALLAQPRPRGKSVLEIWRAECNADSSSGTPLSDAQIKQRLDELCEDERERLAALSAASKAAAALARSLCPRGKAAADGAVSHQPAKRQKRAAAAAELLAARLAHIADAWLESAADFAATLRGSRLLGELTESHIRASCAHLEEL